MSIYGLSIYTHFFQKVAGKSFNNFFSFKINDLRNTPVKTPVKPGKTQTKKLKRASHS